MIDVDSDIDLSEVIDPNGEWAAPVPPGRVIEELFLEPNNISPADLARGLGVPPSRITELIHGARRLTVDTALRLARFFSTSAELWLNLQSRYDLEKVSLSRRELIERSVKPYQAA
jgi:addiction module HigA family antidote